MPPASVDDGPLDNAGEEMVEGKEGFEIRGDRRSSIAAEGAGLAPDKLNGVEVAVGGDAFLKIGF